MPYSVVLRSGPRPWKIINKDTGKIVGSSTSKEKAQSSANAREGSHRGWKPTGKKRQANRKKRKR